MVLIFRPRWGRVTELPKDFIPNDPKRIGGKSKSDIVLDGGIYPRAGRDADSGPGMCDSCNEEKGNVYYGVDIETGEPRAICLLCRVRHAGENTPDSA